MTHEFYLHRFYKNRDGVILLQYKLMLYWWLIVITFYIGKRSPLNHFSFENEKDNDGKFEYGRFIQCVIPISKKIISITCNIYPE